MPNVPLAYVSVYRRMSDIFHTLAYASTIRSSVTGPLDNKLQMILGVSNTAGKFGLTYLAAKAGLPRYTYFL